MESNPEPRLAALEAENEALQQRVRELEQAMAQGTLTRRPPPSGASVESLRTIADAALLRGIADSAPVFIYVKQPDLRYTLWSRRCEELTGIPASSVLGKTADEIFPKEMADAYNESDRRLLETGEPEHLESEFPTPLGLRYVISNRFLVRDTSGEVRALCGILTDITDFRRAQEENRRLQGEMLRVQAETLRALSTPLIPIAEGVVVMPLIGAINRERSQQIMETMLAGVVSLRARIAIFDVTGVPAADAEVAHALNQAARAVRLLGARVVLTGIRPEFAQTLVTLGIDLGGIATLSTLQAGIAYALRG